MTYAPIFTTHEMPPTSSSTSNVMRVHQLGSKLQITYLREKRNAGWKPNTPLAPPFKQNATNAGLEKLPESLRRSRRKLQEYVLCNEFDTFITVTCGDKNDNRYDLEWISRLTRWMRNYRISHNLPEMQYIVIPERHADDAWHAHILITGLPAEHLTPCIDSPAQDMDAIQAVSHIPGYCHWTACESKFGYTLATSIFNAERLVGYITKYWYEEHERQLETLNKRLYYPSRGLKKKKLLAEWECFYDTQDVANAVLPASFDFQSEYCAIQEFGLDCMDAIFQIMQQRCDKGLAICRFLSDKFKSVVPQCTIISHRQTLSASIVKSIKKGGKII